MGSAEGDYYIRVRARDATLAVTNWSNGVGNVHKITVDNTPTNVAPILNVITTPVTIPELSLYNFTATATDANVGNTLTFSLTGNPSGSSINSTTGVFTWTPSEVQGPGSYTFKVKVSDGDLRDSQTIKIRVTEVGNNNGNNNNGPTTFEQCLNGGWRNFSSPSFRNGLDCVKYVYNHLENGPTPDEKKDCKKSGWRSFTNPSFRNQGQCVKFINNSDRDLRNDNRGDKDRDDDDEEDGD